MGIQPDGVIIPPIPRNQSDDDDDEFMWDGENAGFDPFSDLRKRRFLWYFESYMQAIDAAEQGVPRRRRFERMPFESIGNTMDGHFDYPELRRRLVLIREAIISETRRWSFEGLVFKERELSIAVNLQRQHEQIVEDLKRLKNFTVDLALVDDNPFVWELTYFGRPMTQLDGGIFKIKIHLSPRFPEEQPRVFSQTPLFHFRVSKHGVLCYVSHKPEDLRSHVEAIVTALEEEHHPYDPRMTVNPEASKMFWGSADERKQYKRALRRSVERSAE